MFFGHLLYQQGNIIQYQGKYQSTVVLPCFTGHLDIYIFSMGEDKVIPRLRSMDLTNWAKSFHVRFPFLFPITLLLFSSFWSMNLPFSCLLINQGLGSYVRVMTVQTQLIRFELQQEHLGRTAVLGLSTNQLIDHVHITEHITGFMLFFSVESAKIKYIYS